MNEEKKSYRLALGATGLILTHQVIAMYTAIICFIYYNSIFQKAKEQNSTKKHWRKSTILHINDIFLLVGLLQHYLDTSYEVFVPEEWKGKRY